MSLFASTAAIVSILLTSIETVPAVKEFGGLIKIETLLVKIFKLGK